MICVVPPPSSVILRPPSMTVCLLVGRFSVDVTLIVTGSGPQLKVITPPAVAAVLSAAKVQLAAVPVPITLVGLETSAACPFAGMALLQEPFGLPAFQGAAPPLPVEPAPPGVPPAPVEPPFADEPATPGEPATP